MDEAALSVNDFYGVTPPPASAPPASAPLVNPGGNISGFTYVNGVPFSNQAVATPGVQSCPGCQVVVDAVKGNDVYTPSVPAPSSYVPSGSPTDSSEALVSGGSGSRDAYQELLLALYSAPDYVSTPSSGGKFEGQIYATQGVKDTLAQQGLINLETGAPTFKGQEAGLIYTGYSYVNAPQAIADPYLTMLANTKPGQYAATTEGMTKAMQDNPLLNIPQAEIVAGIDYNIGAFLKGDGGQQDFSNLMVLANNIGVKNGGDWRVGADILKSQMLEQWGLLNDGQKAEIQSFVNYQRAVERGYFGGIEGSKAQMPVYANGLPTNPDLMDYYSFSKGQYEALLKGTETGMPQFGPSKVVNGVLQPGAVVSPGLVPQENYLQQLFSPQGVGVILGMNVYSLPDVPKYYQGKGGNDSIFNTTAKGFN